MYANAECLAHNIKSVAIENAQMLFFIDISAVVVRIPCATLIVILLQLTIGFSSFARHHFRVNRLFTVFGRCAFINNERRITVEKRE